MNPPSRNEASKLKNSNIHGIFQKIIRDVLKKSTGWWLSNPHLKKNMLDTRSFKVTFWSLIVGGHDSPFKGSPYHPRKCHQTRRIARYICAMVKSRYIGDGHPTFNRNPYNWHIKPYCWVDDHPLLYGNNGSLDPSTYVFQWPQPSANRLVYKHGWWRKLNHNRTKIPQWGVSKGIKNSTAGK